MNEINKQEQEKYNPFMKLQELRSWSDEVPSEILHGGDKDKQPQFKVRINWW